MKSVKSGPEFAALSEKEIGRALDAYEAQCEAAEGDGAEPPSSDPVVAEVARLIGEYTRRFDEYCAQYEELPEKILDYEPDTPIEHVAFEIFTDAVHDALQAEDDE
ncbi:MAG: hypothetical protein J1E80_00770 [Desulfovibrionaceae bacterium]|nr:hypothetical protein [Desulfovibrionaceae bacterium]